MKLLKLEKLIIALKAIALILITADFILSILILKQNNEISKDLYFLERDVDSVSYNLYDLEKSIKSIESDVDYIQRYMDF